MEDVTDDQLRDDKVYLRNLITNNLQVDRQNIDRMTEVVRILERSSTVGRRRGGPTKQDLLDLHVVLPNRPNVNQTMSKGTIINVFLGVLNQNPQPNQRDDGGEDNHQRIEGDQRQEDDENRQIPRQDNGDQRQEDNEPQQFRQRGNGERVPAGPVPEGWGDLVQNTGAPGPTITFLLKLRRGGRDVRDLPPQSVLDCLLGEQEQSVLKRNQRDQVFLTYIRDNLQELAEKPNPIPEGTSDDWIWYLYDQILQKEILKFQNSILRDGTRNHTATTTTKETAEISAESVSSADSSTQEVVSETDSDLDDYFPKKRYSLPPTKRKRSIKKRRKKKKKKSKKKKKRRSRHSSDSESSSSDEEVEPNGRRVSTKSYGPNHYEQMQEFRDDYATYMQEGRLGTWPDDDALTFISKKFARPGSDFASKQRGVKRRFTSKQEQEHAKKRTCTIYDMCDTVAELRLERNQVLAKAARRARGASQAKRERIRRKARKLKLASETEEQTLLARIGVYCDLVMLGKEAWDRYHSEITLGGQKEAIMESLGGGITASVAAKAWKAAQSAALKPKGKAKSAVIKNRRCNHCNQKGHYSRNCKLRMAGTPPHPGSAQAKWNQKHGGGVTITKVKPSQAVVKPVDTPKGSGSNKGVKKKT